jgi:hypothetical protein
MFLPFSPGLALSLADGTRWLIRAGNTEVARVVAALRLRPALSCPGGGPRRERELLVMASGDGRHGVPPAGQPARAGVGHLRPPPTPR